MPEVPLRSLPGDPYEGPKDLTSMTTRQLVALDKEKQRIILMLRKKIGVQERIIQRMSVDLFSQFLQGDEKQDVGVQCAVH